MTTGGTSEQIDITIEGANEAAVITGTVRGTVTEACGVANGTPGVATATAAVVTGRGCAIRRLRADHAQSRP